MSHVLVTLNNRLKMHWQKVLLLALAFAFLGSRGIWDPDEGRYTAVALNMLSLGDWLVPHRSVEFAHWTKPPLTYWTIATSYSLFGITTWAARLTPAVSYLFSAWMMALMARRLAPNHSRYSALIFATMLLPAGTSQLTSTDMLLTACESLAMTGYVEFRWGDGRTRWLALMYIGFALAFLTKGPPGLLPALAIVVTEIVAPQPRRILTVSGLGIFGLIALPWFVTVIATHPGLLDYFIRQEVVNRVVTNQFGRNGEWYGWATVYMPTLLIGTFPWTGFCLRAMYVSMRDLNHARTHSQSSDDGERLFLLSWILLPLLVFCISRSRLPLYVLPLMLPLALMATRALSMQKTAEFPMRRVLLWCCVLILARVAGGFVHSGQDPAPLVTAIRNLKDGPASEVVFVDISPKYSLRSYLGVDVEAVSLLSTPTAGRLRKFDESFTQEISTQGAREAVWITSTSQWQAVSSELKRRGFQAKAITAPVGEKLLFRVARMSGTVSPDATLKEP